MNIGIVANLLRENSINNNKTLGNSLEKLSTGLKINKASDDASALAISDKLRTQASGIKQGIDNANSAIAMMNIADKSMDELSNILDTIKAKAIQMNTDTTNEDGRKIIKTDILKLIESYDDIVCRTNYNQTPLLNGCASPFDFQVGDDSNEIISVNVDSVESRQMGEADPYKLKNFITGFSMTVAIPEISNTEESNYIFETIGTSGSISTYEITESPVEIPLYIEDRANVKIGIYSNASDSIVTSSMRSLVDYYTEEGFSTENYGSSKLDNYSLDIDLLFIVLPTEEFDNDEANRLIVKHITNSDLKEIVDKTQEVEQEEEKEQKEFIIKGKKSVPIIPTLDLNFHINKGHTKYEALKVLRMKWINFLVKQEITEANFNYHERNKTFYLKFKQHLFPLYLQVLRSILKDGKHSKFDSYCDKILIETKKIKYF